jgi:hypothetical protein
VLHSALVDTVADVVAVGAETVGRLDLGVRAGCGVLALTTVVGGEEGLDGTVDEGLDDVDGASKNRRERARSLVKDGGEQEAGSLIGGEAGEVEAKRDEVADTLVLTERGVEDGVGKERGDVSTGGGE